MLAAPERAASTSSSLIWSRICVVRTWVCDVCAARAADELESVDDRLRWCSEAMLLISLVSVRMSALAASTRARKSWLDMGWPGCGGCCKLTAGAFVTSRCCVGAAPVTGACVVLASGGKR